MKLFLTLLCFSLVLLTGCTSNAQRLEKEIVGTWVNLDGYQIIFYQDGSGFIPGVEGKLPSKNFFYEIEEAPSVLINLDGVKYTVEIKVEGDKLIWSDKIGTVEYKRVNE